MKLKSRQEELRDYFGSKSREAELLNLFPGQEIWHYEHAAWAERLGAKISDKQSFVYAYNCLGSKLSSQDRKASK